MLGSYQSQVSDIFINYRHDDSQGIAGCISDHIMRPIGFAKVFREIETIDPGVLVPEVIAERIRDCAVFITLISANWFDARDASRRRLDSPRDSVRLDIAGAPHENKLIIPVRIEGAPISGRFTRPIG